jgi:hypothetical protein
MQFRYFHFEVLNLRRMTDRDLSSYVWEVADNVEEVHALICECDDFNSQVNAPAPLRNITTTESNINKRQTHILRGQDGRAIATLTLSFETPFDSDAQKLFPSCRTSAYLKRLAVHPRFLETGSIVGAQCIRYAERLAVLGGADAIRCEANPELKAYQLLLMFHFVPCGEVHLGDKRRRIYLYKQLAC